MRNESEKPAGARAKGGCIVGIGASAGGLEALQKLLTALSPDTGFTYIIIQHLSPDYKSLLVEILSKYTAMPIAQAEEGMLVAPNHVYVIQPGKNMRIENGKLRLTAQKERELNLPIDMFFRSLAAEAGPRAIAIVLSGTGSDGSGGIKDVKENDGMVIVQDVESAKFDGMPRSAIRTGLVDAQMPPEIIAQELRHIALSMNSPVPILARTEKQMDDDLMKRIYAILRKSSNVNFTHYKHNTIMRRIERRMMLTHKETLMGYVEYLNEAPEEVKTLSKEVLIGVTSFFRDPDYFQCLKEKAVTDILLRSDAAEPIRVWVAGCSTGEEAYSVAILFCEMMEALQIKCTVKIFATDLDAESIAIAGKGAYGDDILEAVSPARMSRFFTRRNNTYVVSREIRRMIVFSPHNVFQDAPFGRLDLISCRNMLIYFQPVLQNDLFAIFHVALNDGGFLFLGKSENVGAYAEVFPTVDASAKIYTHRADVSIPGAKAVPYLQTIEQENEPAGEEGAANWNVSGTLRTDDRASMNIALLEQFMPACLVVNEKNELVHVYGDSGNIVHMALGRFSNSLFDMLTESLKVPASTLLKDARSRTRKTQYKGIHFVGEREEAVVNLTVMPVSRGAKEGEGLYALVFSDAGKRGELPDAVPYEIDRVAALRISDLEQSLNDARAKLDHSAADQECTNEELQAANEELLTANEELQSSNEELQSVNEELYTVNSEYQQKLSELADLNDDIANFLSSTLIGVIFVDNKLKIRRYTDYVTTEFSVMDHDIGRSLSFISYHFPTVDITEICENVLKTLVPDEREITTGRNKAFLMRVAPYRTTENKILGCVITLVDVTTQKQGLAQLQSTEKRLSLAQRANEVKSDFISRIADEIKAPMDELLELSQTARRQQGDRAALAVNLNKISDMTERISSILTDISDVTQIAPAETEAPKSMEPWREAPLTYEPARLFPDSLAGLHALIVEDNALNRKILSAILEHEGVTCDEATDGDVGVEAFIAAPAGSFDCILMDMRMPRLDGIRATAMIRASGKSDAKTVPIIGVSANGFAADIRKAHLAGVDSYTTKPIDRNHLLSVIGKLTKRCV